MRRKSKPPKPVKPAAKSLADLRRRLAKIETTRQAPPVETKRGRPAKPKPKIEPDPAPKPKERTMPRHRKTETGEVVEVANDTYRDEPTKLYAFHLNLVTPAVEAVPAKDDQPEQPAIPEIVEQQAEGVRWSDRTYTIHFTSGKTLGYLTFASLAELTAAYPKLAMEFVEEPPDDDAQVELDLTAKEAEEKELAAKEARAKAEEAKARLEAKHAAAHA